MKEITTVGTMLEYDGKILILLRGGKEENQPGTWGLAAGRVEPGEEILATALREIKEETGFPAKAEDLLGVGEFVWRQPTVIVHFHAFRLPLQEKIDVKLDPNEHIDFAWKTPEEVTKLDNPIAGLVDLMEKVYLNKDHS